MDIRQQLVTKIPDWNNDWTTAQQLLWFDVFLLVLDAVESLPRDDGRPGGAG